MFSKKRKIKVGIIRSNMLNKWEMQTYELLIKYGISPVAICSQDNLYSLKEINLPIKKVKRIGQFNKIPLVSQIIQILTPLNNWLIGLDKAVSDTDILHTIDQHYPFSYQCVEAGKPTICTVWENIPFNNERSLYKKWKKGVYRKAAHFIAVTNKAKKALLAEGVSKDKITVIPAGINTEVFKPDQKDKMLMKKYGLKKDNINILFVGRLTPEKGILELVGAFSSLARKNTKLRLLIVGKGKLNGAIKRLAKKNKISENIIFLDFLEYSKMSRIYNLADIVCVPSKEHNTFINKIFGKKKVWEEQFGYVFVEAMACGKPVVSTISGSIPEVVQNGKTGVLVKPGNIYELKEALNRLIINNNLRDKIGREGRKVCMKKYNADKIAKQIALLYKKIIN